MPSTNIPIPDKGYFGTSPSARKSVDDLRRQVTKLKADLEIERNKVKQSYRDKGLEIKRIQENFEREKKRAVENVLNRVRTEHATELKKLRDQVAKEKENELRQVVKFKEEEAKALKQQITDEKESNRKCEEELRRVLLDRGKEDTDHVENERKLRNEIHVLREQKQKAEELYRLKASADSEKAENIRRLKAEHEAELQKLIKEAKRESVKEMQHIRSAEKALEDKSQELAFKDRLARKLEAERDELARRRSSVDLESLRRSRLFDSFEDEQASSDPNADVHRRDRERELKKKNSELQAKVEMLEKKCSMLEKHNRHESSSQKISHSAEEKVKKLKKRNSELVSIARQLEEKAKKLQEEKNSAVKHAEGNKADSSSNVEHVKRVMARQRAKDLAEHARALMTRDRQLEELRAQLQMDKRTEELPENGQFEELQSIIRQSAKERLWLERQLSQDGSTRTPSPRYLPEDSSDLRRRFSDLEDENRNLKDASKTLQKAEAEKLKLTAEVREKTVENKQLLNNLEEKQKKCSRLELERERFVAKFTMVQKKNGEMEKKLKELEGMEQEVMTLRETLTEAETERTSLNNECKKLKNQLKELIHVKQELKSSQDKVTSLEKENLTSTQKLEEREQEIQKLHKIQEEANRAHEMAITSFEDTVRGLEQKCAQAERKYSTLSQEMDELQRRRTCVDHKSTQTVAMPSSGRSSSPRAVEIKVAASYEEPSFQQFNSLSPRTPPSDDKEIEEVEADRAGQTPNNQQQARETHDNLDTVALRIKALAVSDSDEDTLNSAASDKKVTERKSNLRVGEAGQLAESEDELALLSRRINLAVASDESSPVSGAEDGYNSDVSQELASVADGDLGDMEDNQRDSSAPEDEQLEVSDEPKDYMLPVPAKANRVMQNGSDDNADLDKGYSDEDAEDDPAIQEKLSVYIARYSYDPLVHSPNEVPDSELAFQAGDYLYVFGEMDEDGFFLGELMNGLRGLVPSNFVEKVADESDMNWIVNGTEEGFDELSDSSDEEESDDDTAELEALSENDELRTKPVRLLKFSGKLHRALRLSTEHIPDSNLGDIKEADDEVGGEMNSDSEDASREVLIDQQHGLISDDTDDLEVARVPSPSRLCLERQFTQSVLVSWKPAEIDANEVKGYAVYVDGEFRMMVKSSSKTKALVENIDPDQSHRISVKTITTKGEESSDRQATLTIGKDATLAPSHVEVTCISPTSAQIEWLPGNSSFCHEVVVNGTPQRLVRPGTCQHTLTNLEPDQEYKVHIRTKNPKLVLDQGQEEDIDSDPLASCVLFRTEPGGLPDPPLDVEIIPGPNHDTQAGPIALEVNWIPVTITDQGTSNGARITGYKVYINDSPCAEVTSPTADSVSVVPWMIERAAKRSRHGNVLSLVVRTQSLDGESGDSNAVEIPLDAFNFKASPLISTDTSPPKTDSKKDQEQRTTVMVNGYEVFQLDMDERGEKNGESRDEAMTSSDATNESATRDVTERAFLAQPRTKGEPVVWRLDVDETETGESTQYDSSSSSNDEQVEICTPLGVKTEHAKENQRNEEKEGLYERLVEEEDEIPESEQLQLHEQKENNETESSSLQGPNEHKKEIEESVNDMSQDEFNRSAKSAPSSSPIIHHKDSPHEDENGKMPFIRPLEYEESDFEDESSQKSLSVIHEEDEDITESRGPPSRISQSHSFSDGFRSEDDVMDLLEEDAEVTSPPHVAASENIRKPSRDEKHPTAVVRPTAKEQSADGLAKYLEQTRKESKPDLSPESADNVLTLEDAIERNSDPEADRRGEEDRTSHQESSEFVAEEQQEIGASESQEELKPVDRTFTVDVDSGAMQEEGEEVRIFIALYDYDPVTMSPNPDAEDEELCFKEGDLVKVYGDKDDDGFYWGELNGVEGYVPFNMVSEVNLDEEDLTSGLTSPAENAPQEEEEPSDVTGAQFQEYQADTQPHDDQQPEVDSMPLESSTDDVVLEECGFEDPRISKNYDLSPRRMVALFDYDPSTLSPNPDSEVELTFGVGDVIYVYGEMDEDGFFTGELRGVRGLVPSNFLEDLPDTPDAPSLDKSKQNSTFESTSSFEKEHTPNGTPRTSEESPKKKKGILSKGKQMFKKMAKGQNNSKGQRSPKR